jgi:hypothetical protein
VGVSEFFVGLISPFFCENKPPEKFQNSNYLLLIFSKKKLKIAPRGPGGRGPNFIFSPEFLFLGAKTPLEIACVSKSVSQSVTKKFGNSSKCPIRDKC